MRVAFVSGGPAHLVRVTLLFFSDVPFHSRPTPPLYLYVYILAYLHMSLHTIWLSFPISHAADPNR